MSGELQSRFLAGALVLCLVGTGITIAVLAVSSSVPPATEYAAPPITLGTTVTTASEPDASDAPTTAVVGPLSTASPNPPVTVVPSLPRGELIATLEIPAIELTATVREGVGLDELELGPGHMPGTAMPGHVGNAVLSGHRTWHTAPFNRLNELVTGDTIRLGAFRYTVTDVLVVSPAETWVLDPTEDARLTLTTCHPIGSARQRLVVVAEMEV